MKLSTASVSGRPASSWRFVDPTSVTTASGPHSASASATSAGSDRTGAAQKTISASAAASRTDPATRSKAPSSRPRWAFAGSASKPATSPSSRRFAASPIEPPIRPTPRTAIRISDGGEFLARGLGHQAKLLRVLGEPIGGHRLRPVADRLLGLVERRDGQQVEREPVGGLERPDAALAQHHAIVALLQHVLGRHQELVQRRRQPALEEDREAGPPRLREKRVVLHVAGPDLD